MSNYFEKYIKYKTKYNLINLKGGMKNSNTAMESHGLLIARKIQANIIQEFNSFPDGYKNEDNNTKLTTILSVGTILEKANIPDLSQLCNLTTQDKLNESFLQICIARHVLPYLENPLKYYANLLTFLMIHHSDLYNYYEIGKYMKFKEILNEEILNEEILNEKNLNEKEKFNRKNEKILDKIISNLASYLLLGEKQQHPIMLLLSKELFSIKVYDFSSAVDYELIAKKLTEFIVSNDITSYYNEKDNYPKIVELIRALLRTRDPKSQNPNHPFIGSTENIRYIYRDINKNLLNISTMSAEEKEKYFSYFS